MKEYGKRCFIDVLKRSERLKTSMDTVILTLRHFNIIPKEIIALELFGMCGLWVTKDYGHYCNYLELWEINPFYAKWAQYFLPNATVQNGDSIEACQKGKLLRNDYNFIVIDSPGGPFNDGNYCEHFDIFPSIFNYTAKNFIMIITIIRSIESQIELTDKIRIDRWKERRSNFYGFKEPSDSINIDLGNLIETYANIFKRSNVVVDRILYVPRNDFLGFLIVKGSKQ